MNKENDILKWYDGEISTDEIKQRYLEEDFSSLEKANFYIKQLEAPKIDVESALEDFRKRKLEKRESKVIPLNYKSFMKIAAAIILLFSVSYIFFLNNEKNYTTTLAQTQTLKLPDDSEVILNAKSSLSFNKKTWKNDRSLRLDGEAFFKVTKGEKFTVNTKSGFIEVLGTQFNVKTRENYFEVKCYEGSVKVTSNFGEEILKPGKTYRVINNKYLSKKDFNIRELDWLSKESVFENTPLSHILEEIELIYGVKFSAEKINTRKLFSGGFTHKNLEKALKSICIPLQLNYKIEGKKVVLFPNATE